MLKKGEKVLSFLFIILFIGIIFVLIFSKNVKSQNNVRTLLGETWINGHSVKLYLNEIPSSAESCSGGTGGCSPSTILNTDRWEEIMIDDVSVQRSPVYIQQHRGNGCPETSFSNPTKMHWYSWNGQFVQEGSFLVVRIRNFGGFCSSENQNNFLSACSDYYDNEIELKVNYPSLLQCNPSDGPCCSPIGTFFDSNRVCASSLTESQPCNGLGRCAGHQTRFSRQKCSGSSALCNGVIEPASEWGACISSNLQPILEICSNGIDDDCDGQLDEPNLQCKSWSSCQDYELCGFSCPVNDNRLYPPNEKCNGIDDDCDALIDEGFPGLGQECSVGVGACRSTGINVCTTETTTACNAIPGNPQSEICDNKDNDCDGLVDESPCTCQNGAFRQCGVNSVGVCRLGTQTCVNGVWRSCNAILPSDEYCDGLDNDCDGVKDNNLVNGVAPDVCLESSQSACIAQGYTWLGVGRCCGNNPAEGIPYGSEICDNKDNDCDGLVDEGQHLCPVICVDGTQENQCSQTKPILCIYNGQGNLGTYQARCDLCGCPSGQNCNSVTGICSNNNLNNLIIINNFSLSQTSVSTHQDINFKVKINSANPILFVALKYFYFNHYPNDDELNQISSWQDTSAVLFDDGLHNDGAATDGEFSGRLIGGFSETGYYVFKIEAYNIYMYSSDASFSHRQYLMNVRNPGVGQSCSAIEVNGNPEQKINIYFVANANTGSSASMGGYNGNNPSQLQQYADFTNLAVNEFKTTSVLNEYNSKFNYYRINQPLELYCYKDPRWPMSVCTLNNNVMNSILDCGPFKFGRNPHPFTTNRIAGSDKVVFALNAPEIDNFYLGVATGMPGYEVIVAAASTTYNIHKTTVHELGHTFGIYDYYNYLRNQTTYVKLDCNNPRNCIMCELSSAKTFACQLNNRESCNNRTDVPIPDLFHRSCKDNYLNDEAYLRALWGNVP